MKYYFEALCFTPTPFYTLLNRGMIVYYNLTAESFHTKKLCTRLYSIEFEFYSQKRQIDFMSHPLGDLGVTYTVHLWLVRKPEVDFLLMITERFSLALTCRDVTSGNLSKSAFLIGVGHFEHKF